MKYKVKLLENHKATKNQITSTGYLGVEDMDMIYDKSDALKKAKLFGGEIEVVPLSKVLKNLSITQIPENALLDWVVRQLEVRASFVDTNLALGEKIYHGTIFQDILIEYYELKGSPLYPKEKYIKHLQELAQIIDTDYVMISKV